MPELPEVETIRRGLVTHVSGKQIADIEILHPRAVHKASLELNQLIGQQITSVARRGKFLWFIFPECALIGHLGMSGQFRIDSPDNKHRRATLYFTDGSQLDFIDQRTFGYLRLDTYVHTPDGKVAGQGTEQALMPASVAHIGRDLVDPHIDLKQIAKRAKLRKTRIKTLLLDQHFVSGIGNIYADESLFAARVNGMQPANTFSTAKLLDLYEKAREILAQATAMGGTSFDELYVNVNGSSGYFSRHLNVYGKDGTACPRCGKMLLRVAFMGRSSVYCPKCQPIKR